jgi:hypothetical protein
VLATPLRLSLALRVTFTGPTYTDSFSVPLRLAADTGAVSSILTVAVFLNSKLPATSLLKK